MLKTKTVSPLSGKKPTSAIILLHGLGADGADLISLGEEWRDTLPDTEFLAPDAPFPCDMASFGYQWFSLQDQSPEAILAGVKQAAPMVNNYIDEVLKTRELSPRRLALVGFSQGTMMSLYVGLRREEQLACIVGYSGLLVDAENLPAEKKSSPPILLFHGMMDPVIPFFFLDQTEKGLKAAGLSVESYARKGLGHGIDSFGMTEGLSFLKKALT